MAVANLSLTDGFGLAFFVAAWLAYHLMTERANAARPSLNQMMNLQRYRWMRLVVERENRIMDANINATLQNGSAFFASTSLIAIGGSLTLLRSASELVALSDVVPLGADTTRAVWELKVLGLTVIFVYAFFKFAWSYRLFNYGAILIGAIPNLAGPPTPATEQAAWRAATMNMVAGRHFNRGQRAFFFSLAYLGWFVSSYLLVAATAGVLYVMWHRQFSSDARAALADGVWPDPS